MNMEKVILELLSRIQVLEENDQKMKTEIAGIQEALAQKTALPLPATLVSEVKKQLTLPWSQPKEEIVSYQDMRLEAITILRKKFPYYQKIDVDKQDANGILLQTLQHTYRLRYGYSRSHVKDHKNRYLLDSWHTMNANIIDKYDFYVFAVPDEKEKMHHFLFRQKDMLQHCQKKNMGKMGRYHFYFHIAPNGVITEGNGKRAIAVRPYYENWDILKELP